MSKDDFRGGTSRTRTEASTARKKAISQIKDPREKAIATAATKSKSDRIKDIEQGVGSLDRRINKAIKGGDTSLAKDLRSRENKLTTKLGIERALQLDGGVVRSKDGKIIRTSTGQPILTSKGRTIFDQTKDQDFIDPTRRLKNLYPKEFGKMYPIQTGLERGIKLLMKDFKKRNIPYSNPLMPAQRYPLQNIDPFAGKSFDPNVGRYYSGQKFYPSKEDYFYETDTLENVDDTNIEVIKETKNKNKSTDTLQNIYEEKIFRDALVNPQNVRALPPNFENTLNRLTNINALTSGDYLKAKQLLDNFQYISPTDLSSGIVNSLPSTFEVAENTFFAPTISDTLQSLSDNKGFDVNVQNPGITYSKDFLGGTIEAGISGIGTDEPKAGLFYNKVI
tara:strand:- start:6320 stop:7498 length:1179 start_codon:yes stop_codon:yes gene_type:complete